MGGYTGKYSRNPFSVFNEEKNYAFALMQEGVPVTDDDSNDDRISLFTRQRRMVQLFGNYGTPNEGFRIIQSSSPNNNFTMQSGSGPSNLDIEAAGRFFVRGISCLLLHDVEYMNLLTDLAEQSIHPRATNVYYDGVSHTVVEDSAAAFVTNELQNRTVTINSTNHTITDNTLDQFRISGDVTSSFAIGDHYILWLSTPGAVRTDAVYLNVYLDEYDGTDDPDILKEIGGTTVEAQLRAKVIQTLFVREDVTGLGELIDYDDSNGNPHLVFKLATLNRTAVPAITNIDDHVPTIGFTNISQDQLATLKVIENPAGADDQVYVQAGRCRTTDGAANVVFSGGLAPAITNNPGTGNERYDIVYIDNDGDLNVYEGVAATVTNAVVPTFPNHLGTCLAALYVEGNATTVVIEDEDIDDIRPILSERGVTDLAARPLDAPSENRVWVNRGSFFRGAGEFYDFGGGVSPTFNTVSAGQARWDLVYVSVSGVVGKTQGTPSTLPTQPTKPDANNYYIPVAYIYVDEDSSVVVDAEDIVDARPAASTNSTGRILGTRNVAATAPNYGNAMVWDNGSLEWEPGPPAGWKVLESAEGSLVSQFTTQVAFTGDRFWMNAGTYTVGGQWVLDGVTVVGAKEIVQINVGASDQIVLNNGAQLHNVQIVLTSSSQANYYSIVEVIGENCVIDGISMTSSTGVPNQQRRLFGIHVQLQALNAVVRNCILDDVGDYAVIKYGQLLDDGFVDPSAMYFSTDSNDRLGDGTPASSLRIAQQFQVPPTWKGGVFGIWIFVRNSATGAGFGGASLTVRIEGDSGSTTPNNTTIGGHASVLYQNSFEDTFQEPAARVGTHDGVWLRFDMYDWAKFASPGNWYWIVLLDGGGCNYPLPVGGSNSASASPYVGAFRRWTGSSWVASTGGLERLAFMIDEHDDTIRDEATCLIENNQIHLRQTNAGSSDYGVAGLGISSTMPAPYDMPIVSTSNTDVNNTSSACVRILNNTIRIRQAIGFSPTYTRGGIQASGGAAKISKNKISVTEEPGTIFTTIGILAGDRLGALFQTDVLVEGNSVQGTTWGINLVGMDTAGLETSIVSVRKSFRNMTVIANKVFTAMIDNTATVVMADPAVVLFSAAIAYCGGTDSKGSSIVDNQVTIQGDQSVTSPNCSAIWGYRCDLIQGNAIRSSGSAIAMHGIRGGNNIFDNQIFNKVDARGHGFQYSIRTEGTSSVSNNWIDSIGWSAAGTVQGYGIYVSSGAHIVIAHNTITYFGNAAEVAAAINLVSCFGCTVTGNVMEFFFQGSTYTAPNALLDIASTEFCTFTGNMVLAYDVYVSNNNFQYGIRFASSSSYNSGSGNGVHRVAAPGGVLTPVRFDAGCNYNTYSASANFPSISNAGTGNQTTGSPAQSSP